MSTENFALLCKVISRFELPLESFLINSRNYVTEKMEELTPQELGDVLFTYLVTGQDVPLAQEAEERIMKIRRKLTIDDCISLMNAYMLYDSSEDLWTAFDIVIGRNINKVEEDQIVPILHMFSKAPTSRNKLYQVFVHKIKSKFSIWEK